MTDRKDKKLRLERAGYVHVSGWLPAAWAEEVMQQVDMHAEDVAKITEAPALPRGRPAKRPLG